MKIALAIILLGICAAGLLYYKARHISQKAIKKTGIAVFAVSMLFIIGLYFHIQPKNPDAADYVVNYMQNSADISLMHFEPEEIRITREHSDKTFSEVYKKYNKHKTIRTGIRKIGYKGRGSELNTVELNTIVFQDGNSSKYFQLTYIEAFRTQTSYIHALLRDELQIEAKANKYYLENNKYGTLENPIPIMMWSFPKSEGRKDYEIATITEEQHRNNIYYYLAYIIPKEEFNSLFKNK